MEGAGLHAGKTELSSIEIAADPIAESALVTLTRDDEYRMTMYFNHITSHSLNLDILPPVKLGVDTLLCVIAMLDHLDHSFFPTLSQWVMTNDPNDPTLR